MAERLISVFGLAVMVLVAFLFSSHKKNINWRTVLSGIALQVFLGLVILKTSFGHSIFDGARVFFNGVLSFTNEGSEFIFGPLAKPEKLGFIFFTMVLPMIIFISSLMNILYHLGIMQIIIKAFAYVMVKVMGVSGAESLAAAANIFLGQTEAPLVVKPLIQKMTRSELMALMSGGMSTVAGGVLAAFVGMGIDAGHLLAASAMSAPAALVCAKILIPELERSSTGGKKVNISFEKNHVNLIDAAASGAADGLKLALNVAAMLLSFIAIIALVNWVVSYIGSLFGMDNLSLELIAGYIFSPVAWLMGVSWQDSTIVGSLIGKKVIINEFVAYLDLKDLLSELSPRSSVIATYALCGFANFSSIAIQVGGIGSMAPNKRGELAKLGLKSLLAGTLACFMTACVAGIFL